MHGEAGDKVMHASMRIGDCVVTMTDGSPPGGAHFAGFSLSLTVADDAEAQRRLAALAEGGQVRLPLERTYFAASFGMLADRFGMPWMVVTRD